MKKSFPINKEVIIGNSQRLKEWAVIHFQTGYLTVGQISFGQSQKYF
jgi:hypothetical protein